MRKNQFSNFINLCRFIFSWEDSGEMQADLRIDIQKTSVLEYLKTFVWITASIFISLLICKL